MTKAIKWYKKFSIWQTVMFVISPLVGVGEAIIVSQSVHWAWHFVVAGLGGCIAALKYFGKDENNNGIVDVLEKKP